MNQKWFFQQVTHYSLFSCSSIQAVWRSSKNGTDTFQCVRRELDECWNDACAVQHRVSELFCWLTYSRWTIFGWTFKSQLCTPFSDPCTHFDSTVKQRNMGLKPFKRWFWSSKLGMATCTPCRAYFSSKIFIYYTWDILQWNSETWRRVSYEGYKKFFYWKWFLTRSGWKLQYGNIEWFWWRLVIL